MSKINRSIPTCLECGERMVLSKTSNTLQGKTTQYKIRRYVCTLCGYTETISGGGDSDIHCNPVVIEKVRKKDNIDIYYGSGEIPPGVGNLYPNKISN